MLVTGVVIIDKQADISSHKEMRRVQNLFVASKAGHGGTLDPIATGMLPIYFGEATKYIQYALDANKTYIATGCFGSNTDTADLTGKVIWQYTGAVVISREVLVAIMQSMLGESIQIPSMYSAIKHQGKPMYYYARQGQEILRKSRMVNIESFELLAYAWPYFKVRVVCSKGTYIRNLLQSLGDSLAVGAHMTALYRESVANYSIELMYSYAALQQFSADQLQLKLLPVDFGLQHLPLVILSALEIMALQQGKLVTASNSSLQINYVYRLYDQTGNFFGLIQLFYNNKQDLLQFKAHRMMSFKSI